MKLFYRLLIYLNIFENKNKYNVTCPFHNDTNASFHINLDTESFYCFGCDVKGNDIDLAKLIFKTENIFEISNGLKSVNSFNYQRITIEKKQYDKEQMLELSKNYYETLQQLDWNNLNDDLIYLYKYMIRRGFNGDVLNKIKAKYTHNDRYPIVFPLCDSGVFKGYIKRTTNIDVEKVRKYLYNEGFVRKECLIGNYNSKTVLVTEGFLDMVKAQMYGAKYSVALLGWKASDIHIDKMKKAGVENVISALDNDKPGINGTIYLKKFFKVYRFKFPKGVKDLGEINEQQFKESIKGVKL